MSLFATFGAVAVAGTNDPYLMPYDEAGGGLYQYTHILGNADTEAYITFGPGIDIGGQLFPSYYDSAVDAENVSFKIIEDDGISGAEVNLWAAFDAGTNQWATEAVIELPDDGSHGSVSVKITNNNSGISTNITVARNEADPASDTSARIWLQVYDPADPTGNLEYENRYDAPSNAFYENWGSRSYPTALDALTQAWTFPIYPTPTYIPELTNVSTLYVPGEGDFVTSMTVNGTVWSSDDVTQVGWLYAIYRATETPGEYARVEIGKYVGSDCYKLFAGDLIMWKYGNWETQYDALFPDTYYRP